MERIAILIDSTSQFSEVEAREMGFFYLPLQIINGEKTYLEGIDVNEKQIYQMFEENKDLILKTSQPSVGITEEEIQKIKSEGYDTVLPLLIGSGISATSQSTIMAIKNNGLNVIEFDSTTTSAELGYMIMEAKKMVENNASKEEIINKLEDIRKNSNTYFVVSDLSYLRAGGRITPTAALLAGMLKIIPIMTLNKELKGMPDSFAKVRSVKKVFATILKDFEKRNFNPETHEFIIMYGSEKENADQLLNAIKEVWPDINIKKAPISLIVSAHTGPNIYGVQVIKR